MSYQSQLSAIGAQADAAIAAATVAPPATAPSVVSGSFVGNQSWKLTFSDEFLGNALDGNKWNTGRWSPTTTGDAPYNNGKEGAYFASSQVTVAGSNALLTCIPTAPKTLNGNTFAAMSGEINTQNKYVMTPGCYIEARIAIPNAPLCWPAFWLLPNNSQWPPEIDIFEYFDSSKQNRPSFNYHRTSTANGQSGPTTYGASVVDYRVGYHTYGLHWSRLSVITAYLDGVPSTSTTVDTSLPHYVIMNLSTYAGAAQPTATMYIDWFRAWA